MCYDQCEGTYDLLSQKQATLTCEHSGAQMRWRPNVFGGEKVVGSPLRVRVID